MNYASCVLSVFFEDPFWVALLERQEGSSVSFCKITFGAEPKSGEIYEYLAHSYYGLGFSPPVAADPKKKANPKRMKRQIAQQLHTRSSSTKAQAALQMQNELFKQKKRCITAAQKKEEKEFQFELRQKKKKKKRRGH